MTPVLDAVRREELRKLAEAATPGPWAVQGVVPSFAVISPAGDAELGTYSIARDVWFKSNAAYIAAMSPDTTLALLAYIAELETGPTGMQGTIDEIINGTSPMSKWTASVDYSTYDGFEEYLKAQLRDKLSVKVVIDKNRSGDRENLASFVDGGVGALEAALGTYRVVRQRLAALLPKASVREELG